MGRLRQSGWWLGLVFVTSLNCAVPVRAQSALDCFGDDNERRIVGCSDIIAAPGTAPDELSTAYAMRALGYSLKGLYDLALPDYDRALGINPDFAIALNNRAWALFKAGRAREGVLDVEKSLALSPASPHTYDTRAHIRQALGNPKRRHRRLRNGDAARRRAHDQALPVRPAGQRPVRGPRRRHLYAADARGTGGLRQEQPCDPLPPDEECRAATS